MSVPLASAFSALIFQVIYGGFPTTAAHCRESKSRSPRQSSSLYCASFAGARCLLAKPSNSELVRRDGSNESPTQRGSKRRAD